MTPAGNLVKAWGPEALRLCREARRRLLDENAEQFKTTGAITNCFFSASKLYLPIRDLPVHYQERIYGVTKMARVFSNGMHPTNA